jgi:hypothetical protein
VSSRGQLIVGGTIAVVVLLAVVAYVNAEIVEHGHLLPWAGDDVRKARFFDRFDLYISSETGKPSADLVNSYLLLATAAVCLTASILLDPPDLRVLLVVAGIGIAYLAIDEQFAIHESVGHNLRFLADLPGVKRPDDVVLAAYSIPSALFIYYFRPLLRASPRTMTLLVTTLLLFGVSAAWDLSGLPAEEIFELAPSLALLGAFVFLTTDFAGKQKSAA